MGYIDELKIKVANLERTSDIQEAEISLLLSGKEDTLRPSVAMFEMAGIIMEMLVDNAKFIKKNGMTAKASESRERLLKLMDHRNEFARIATQAAAIKSTNFLLHAQNTQLRINNSELKKQLETYHATTKEL